MKQTIPQAEDKNEDRSCQIDEDEPSDLVKTEKKVGSGGRVGRKALRY